MSKVYYDIRHDGKFVNFFNHDLKWFETRPAEVYKGPEQIVACSKGSNIRQMTKEDWLVFTPEITEGLLITDKYGWYAKKCSSKAVGCEELSVNTDWRPVPIDNSSQFATLEENRKHNDVYIVQSKKLPGFNTISGRYIVVPLLETIINVHPEFYGLSLLQIACELNNGFEGLDFNPNARMVYLFNMFKAEFASLCIEEACPIQHLYSCNFNHKFNHNSDRDVSVRKMEVMKRLENVVMLPLSATVILSPSTTMPKEIYGNIPWTLASKTERAEFIKGNSYVIEPFAFFPASKASSSNDILKLVAIFPELKLSLGNSLEKIIPSGSMIYLRPIPGSTTKEVEFRGDLFEGMTSKEKFILMQMFDAFSRGKLSEETDPLSAYRNMDFTPEQLLVRKEFIKMIQLMLLQISR